MGSKNASESDNNKPDSETRKEKPIATGKAKEHINGNCDNDKEVTSEEDDCPICRKRVRYEGVLCGTCNKWCYYIAYRCKKTTQEVVEMQYLDEKEYECFKS